MKSKIKLNAINGKVDHLNGLKENVLIGKLIPAGTGMKRYRDIGLSSDAQPETGIPAEEEAGNVYEEVLASVGEAEEIVKEEGEEILEAAEETVSEAAENEIIAEDRE